MSEHIELEIPARADFLALARLVVVAAASLEHRLGEERLDNLRLAVSEACANAINAQAGMGSEAAIRIRCELAEDRVEVEVVDHGPGFDPDGVPPLPAPNDPARLEHEGGLGLQLIRSLTDDSAIASSATGTAVRLVLFADNPPPPPTTESTTSAPTTTDLGASDPATPATPGARSAVEDGHPGAGADEVDTGSPDEVDE